MSESSGGQALAETPVSNNQIEVRLLFNSRDYTLSQLAGRIRDVESLMTLLLQGRNILRPRRPITPRQSGIRRVVAKRASRANLEHLKGFKIITRNFRGIVVNTRAYGTMPDVEVRVETVSLSSPLEIVLLVSGPIAVLTAIAKLLPKFIEVKNAWNNSRILRAESNLAVERLKLESEIVKLYASEVEGIDLENYAKLKNDHPSKQIVKGAVKALSNLDKAEVRD
ncbi:hypothetical protein QFZ36_000512 [Pseudarthrobacter siccitolerans]|uniref:Uncharacterized protein n=1 Tax=Pseudarthrobacter siccitolerans TaxID=861266 RepID=A0ABU0PI35_9MICC|nr:hypothetical protein [Pseudarthrobacter siccitolerans]MDQ0672951.1 hypothetical protein [Pseudarthrobacter siccitolerans]